MLDEFLKNELSFNRESGTYLFYGDDLEKNYNIALEFSAELFSKNIENEIEKNKINFKKFIQWLNGSWYLKYWYCKRYNKKKLY